MLLHSHPTASRWQPMSRPDPATPSPATPTSPARSPACTGRHHPRRRRHHMVRPALEHRNRQRRRLRTRRQRPSGRRPPCCLMERHTQPPPRATSRQVRTLSAWGDRCQADLARRRILVVGAGSVGLDIAVRLAASGLCRITIMDFDIVKAHNLDRLIGATPRDARLRRPQTHVARREATAAATAQQPHNRSLKPLCVRTRRPTPRPRPRPDLLLRRPALAPNRPSTHWPTPT